VYRVQPGTKNSYAGAIGSGWVQYPVSEYVDLGFFASYSKSRADVSVSDIQNAQGEVQTIGQSMALNDLAAGIKLVCRLPFGNNPRSAIRYARASDGYVDASWQGAETGREATNPLYEGAGQSNVNPLYESRRHKGENPLYEATGSGGALSPQGPSDAGCGPVVSRTYHPSGEVTELTFSCVEDAAGYALKSTVPKQTQGTTFGEKVNAGLVAPQGTPLGATCMVVVGGNGSLRPAAWQMETLGGASPRLIGKSSRQAGALLAFGTKPLAIGQNQTVATNNSDYLPLANTEVALTDALGQTHVLKTNQRGTVAMSGLAQGTYQLTLNAPLAADEVLILDYSDATQSANVLKTKHDTAKNSVGNIR
jgi:hypothetical protein